MGLMFQNPDNYVSNPEAYVFQIQKHGLNKNIGVFQIQKHGF
jgi:hypothetical protein